MRGAYGALKPGGQVGGAVLQAALFVAISAAAVPTIDQSTFAFYVDTDRDDWVVQVQTTDIVPENLGE